MPLIESKPFISRKRAGFTLILLLAAYCLTNRTDHQLTESDIPVLTKYLSPIKYVKPELNSDYSTTLSFEEQITLLLQIQHIILKQSAINTGKVQRVKIHSMGFVSSPSTTIDHSLFFEKAFQSVGFRTRHVRLYDNENSFIFLKNYLSEQHIEISEVLTKKGWLIVDPKNTWVGLSEVYQPISMEQLKEKEFVVDWLYPVLLEGTPSFEEECYFFYD